jgi:hypothetical protein
MDELKNKSKLEYLKMLRELDESEKQLKKRRALIQSQRPWYTNPTNIIGIATILVTVFISLFSILSNSKKLELTCTYSAPKPLTSFSSKIQENISINYKENSVSNIGKINVSITNTGTEGLTREYFADGPIEFDIINNDLVSQDSLKTLPFLLDIAVLDNANQRNDILKIISSDCNSKFTYLPSLINPGDKVEFELYISDINNVKTNIEGNISNGELILIEEFAVVKRSNFQFLCQSIVGLFGLKWIPIVILVVMLLLMILRSFFMIDEAFEVNVVDVIFGALFIISDLVILILIIGVIRV